ncbi:MAG: zf-HC2 domain-containing protein [Planctomycetota bacterium]
MKCDEIRTLLNPYVDNELPGEEAGAVKRHLEACPACAKEVAVLNKVKALLCKLPACSAPEALLERVQAGLPRPVRKDSDEGYTNESIKDNKDGLSNGASPADSETQGTGVLWRYRWLSGSLASAAAVLLVVFIVMTQPRKSDIKMPDIATAPEKEYAEKAKANLKMDSPTADRSEVADSLQPQPMLYTQQINISARDVNAAIDKIYYVASLDLAVGRDDEKSFGKAGGAPEKGRELPKVTDDKDLLAKAQNRQAIVTNVGAPYRETRSQVGPSYSQSREKSGQHILKVAVPLSQKDEFIRRLKGNIPDQMVFAEMKSGPGAEPKNPALDMLAEANKASGVLEEKEVRTESAKETGKAGGGYQYDKMARAGGRKEISGKQPEEKKPETPKLAPPASPPPSPASPATPAITAPAPPASRPAEGLIQSPSDKKKEQSKDSEKQEAKGGIQNEAISPTAQVKPSARRGESPLETDPNLRGGEGRQQPDAETTEPTVEFIIVIEQSAAETK